MKGILLDENLPDTLVLPTSLAVRHVSDIGTSLTDSRIWHYAKTEALIIVTKDADFYHRILVSEPPPWIVHLRLGNLRLRAFEALIIKAWASIEAEFPQAKAVSVYSDQLRIIS